MADRSPAASPHAPALLIPKTFHFVWLGGKRMPAEFVEFRRTWADHHPDWQIAVWDESTLPRLRNQEWFDRAESWSQKVDIASFELLHRHGGIYLDTDFECLKNIEGLLGGVDVFSASEDRVHVCHGIMGCTPGHPLLDRLVGAVEHSILSQPGQSPAVTTGPHLITKVFKQWIAEGNHATVFAPELFYPYHYDEKHRRHETFPDAFAAHHWAGSWLPENQPARRRLVLVADWDRPAAALLGTLGAFCRLFSSSDPVELVLGCPVGEESAVAERIMPVIDEMDPGALPELWVNTFEELLSQPFDIAVAPTGDDVADGLATARAVEWMSAVRSELDGGPRKAPEIGGGDLTQLREALAA
jgi:glycosyl transferase-like sugar-binding protein